MTLPPIPQKEGVDRNWSPETWRAGLDEAVRRDTGNVMDNWREYCVSAPVAAQNATIAHATTLLDADIVKPVVSEAEELLRAAHKARCEVSEFTHMHDCPAAIAVIQSALDKARAGE